MYEMQLQLWLLLMDEFGHGAGGDDFGGFELAEDGVLGQVEAVDSWIEAELHQPLAHVVLAEFAAFEAGAVGSQLFDVDVDKIGVGHMKLLGRMPLGGI